MTFGSAFRGRRFRDFLVVRAAATVPLAVTCWIWCSILPAAPPVLPKGPGELPTQLSGRWEIAVCFAGEHTWLRFESLQTGEVHTLSRVERGWGGLRDEQTREWLAPVARSCGVHWDQDLVWDSRFPQEDHVARRVVIDNPHVYRGDRDGRGYNVLTNNCATFVREAWETYTGERYRLLWPHLPADLRFAILTSEPRTNAHSAATSARSLRVQQPVGNQSGPPSTQ
jgi:hypothetical protein